MPWSPASLDLALTPAEVSLVLWPQPCELQENLWPGHSVSGIPQSLQPGHRISVTHPPTPLSLSFVKWVGKEATLPGPLWGFGSGRRAGHLSSLPSSRSTLVALILTLFLPRTRGPGRRLGQVGQAVSQLAVWLGGVPALSRPRSPAFLYFTTFLPGSFQPRLTSRSRAALPWRGEGVTACPGWS